MTSISFLGDVDTLFTQTQKQQDDYEQVFKFIQFSQPYMENVYRAIVEQAEKNGAVQFIVPMEFVYRQTYKQIDDLFKKIDSIYEKNPSSELLNLLRQCSRLRATVADICSVLRQLQTSENQATKLTDTELRAWVNATVQYYGAKA